MFWRKRKAREQDLERELRSDLELEAAEQREKGISEDESRYAAKRALGNRSLVKEHVRESWGGQWLDDIGKDVLYAIRHLRHSPGFTATAVLSLAIAIGANTSIFTLINAVLLKSLPVRDPGSLVLLGEGEGSGNGSGIPRDGSFSLYSYDLYKHIQTTKVFDELCAVQSTTQTGVSVRRQGWIESRLAQARLVSGNYFGVLGIKAVIGRAIEPSDDLPSAVPVAVVSFRCWKDKLDGHASAIGSNIDVSGVPVTIIGVAPPQFFGEVLTPDPPELWLPISTDRQLNRERALVDLPDDHWLYLLGRLAPNISTAQAQSRLTASLHDWLFSLQGSKTSAEDRKEILRSRIQITPGGSGIRRMQREYSLTLQLLLGISIAVLLITCANIANLLLAQGTARTGETSVRLALGASRWRLVRQSLTESLTLALAGGALGLFAASSGTKVLIVLFFRGNDYVPLEISPDIRILAFTLIVSSIAAIVFGLLPAMRMSARLSPLVKGTSPGIKGSRLSGPRFGLGAALVVAEVALSLVVLAGAGTFALSLANINGQQFGFNRDRVLVVNLDTPHAGYTYSQLAPLYRQMYSRLNALPGVRSASLSYYSPFNNCCWAYSTSIQGYTPKPGDRTSVRLNRVSPGYFRTLGTHLLLGRDFLPSDSESPHRVAIVTEEFVHRFLLNKNPLGKHFGIGSGNGDDLEIVGVVGDAKYDSPREELTPMAFLPLLQARSSQPHSADLSKDQSNFVGSVELLTAGRPEMATEVRHALAEIDPSLPILRVGTLSEDIDLMLNQENVVTALAIFFGSVALILSCLGLYGLMAYSVERRTSEIGIRIALGARRHGVIALVIRDALVQGLIGIAIGIPAAFVTLQLIADQLYGVNPHDLSYSAAAAMLLLLCITLAGYIPALRASRIDPLIALRYE